MLHGNDKLALHIFRMKINPDEKAFHEFIAEGRRQATPTYKASATATVSDKPELAPTEAPKPTPSTSMPSKKSPPTGKKTKLSTPAMSEKECSERDLILNALTKFTEKRVLRCFKTMDFERCLFDIPVALTEGEPKLPFILHIANSTENSSILVSDFSTAIPNLMQKAIDNRVKLSAFLKKIQNLEKKYPFTEQAKYRLMKLVLTYSCDGFLKEPYILDWLAHALCREADERYPEELSLLSWLTTTRERFIIFKKIFDAQKKMILNIPISRWGSSVVWMRGPSGLYPLPLLHRLACCADGIYILSKLFNLKPQAIAEIPPSAWADKDYHNATPLYALVGDAEGMAVFRTILHKRPEIIKAIPMEVWTIPFSSEHSSNERSNSTPLGYIAGSHLGQEVMLDMLKILPGLIESIPAEAWGKPLTAMGDKHNYTPLISLISSEYGHKILSILLTHSPELILAIPSLTWGLVSKGAHGNENITSLTLLTNTNSSRVIFHRLVNELPSIIKNMPAHAWGLIVCDCKQNPQLINGMGHTPLACLTCSADGLDILQDLIEKLPLVIRAIPAAAWKKAPNCHASPLSTLAQSVQGQSILIALKECLQHHPELIAKINELTTVSSEHRATVIAFSESLNHHGLFQTQPAAFQEPTTSIPTGNP